MTVAADSLPNANICLLFPYFMSQEFCALVVRQIYYFPSLGITYFDPKTAKTHKIISL